MEIYIFLKYLNRKLSLFKNASLLNYFSGAILSKSSFPWVFGLNKQAFSRRRILHCIYVSLSAFSCFENISVQCLLEAGEGFSMLFSPCQVCSFFQQRVQFGMIVRILTCMDSWPILWHRILWSSSAHREDLAKRSPVMFVLDIAQILSWNQLEPAVCFCITTVFTI